MKNSTKNFLLLFLVLVALGVGSLAWRQYLELITLRAMNVNPAERAAEQAQLTAAQRYSHELEGQLAALRDSTQSASDSTATGAATNRSDFGRGRGGANMRAMMDTPEVRRLVALQQRASLDAHFAPLFKALNLPAAQLDKFKSLLVEKQSAVLDTVGAAREQGVDPRTDPDGFRRLLATTQADIDTNLKAVLGDDGFAQYQQYQQAQPRWNVVNQLSQNLSYTDSPLSDAQATQLMQILASTSTQVAGVGGPPERGGPGSGEANAGALITPQTVAQAQSVLSPAQVQALQQLQQTQQAQQQLEQIIRNNGGGPSRGANDGGG